jgi:hypothetical protein
MRIRLVKWLCIAALFVGFVLWRWIASYGLPLKPVMCWGAAVVAVQAFYAGSQPLVSIPPLTDRNPGSESL